MLITKMGKSTVQLNGAIFIEITNRKSSKNDEEKSKAAPRHNQPIARKLSSKLPVTS